MLVDTGFSGFGRVGNTVEDYLDPAKSGQRNAEAEEAANRIMAATKAAGVKQIDYLVITHYHSDHTGGVAALSARIPIKTFVDHGEPASTAPGYEKLPEQTIQWEKASLATYTAVRQNHPHLPVKPGDTIPIKGIRVEVVSAGGGVIEKPLAGGGERNPLCGGDFRPQPLAQGENARSIGMIITFGKLRIADFGDLQNSTSERLVCPVNLLGRVDLYMTAHHGVGDDNPPPTVWALHPRVALMNNTPTHGGEFRAPAQPVWVTLHSSPGFVDLWQLHFSDVGEKAHNAPAEFIANLTPQCEGKWIEVSATADGAFVVRNSRNGFEKKYPATSK